jgi:hypothetical protein
MLQGASKQNKVVPLTPSVSVNDTQL